MENFKTKLTNVKAFIFDVDGVLTDGSVTLMPDGLQSKTMSIKDGYALQLAIKKGYKIAIISGGNSEIVRTLMKGLGITDVFLKSHTKIDSYNEFIASYDLNHEEILYMGDDIPDYEVMKKIGVPTCPGDAAQEIKDICIYISQKNGGKGAVRDVIEQVLRVHGKWMDKDGFVW
jgi:3-deoxy-D-manno-octulosonate 8-phosphate phosphatase (KDO 8-P phosphatase)